jgi:hypothetical protein
MELPGQNDPSQTTAGPPPLPALPPQLSQANLAELQTARLGLTKIRRAVTMARFDGWSVGIFGALTLICGLFSFWGFVMGTGMIIIAYVELKGAEKVKRLQPGVIRTLALNQLAMASLLIIYAVWSIATTNASTILSDLGADSSMVDAQLVRLVTWIVYGAVIAVAVFCQGGMALYYITREKYLRAYLAETPPWIITMQQAGVSI